MSGMTPAGQEIKQSGKNVFSKYCIFKPDVMPESKTSCYSFRVQIVKRGLHFVSVSYEDSEAHVGTSCSAGVKNTWGISAALSQNMDEYRFSWELLHIQL